jgi:hypothetical protein
MVFGTPGDRYDPEAASSMLRGFGEQTIALARNNLLSRGVLSKILRDPTKNQPGRALKISDINSNALGGSIHRDIFQDAATLEGICKEPSIDWREWPLLASDGDLAMLVQAASAGEVFNVKFQNPVADKGSVGVIQRRRDACSGCPAKARLEQQEMR